MKHMKFTGLYLDGDQSLASPVFDRKVHHLEFREEAHVLKAALLIKGKEDRVTGPVGRITCPPDSCRAEIPGVSAEASLGYLAFRCPRKRHSHMFQFDDRPDSVFTHYADRRLVT